MAASVETPLVKAPATCQNLQVDTPTLPRRLPINQDEVGQLRSTSLPLLFDCFFGTTEDSGCIFA